MPLAADGGRRASLLAVSLGLAWPPLQVWQLGAPSLRRGSLGPRRRSRQASRGDDYGPPQRCSERDFQP